jgi:hypothetical protein
MLSLRAPFVYGLKNQRIILKDALSSYLHRLHGFHGFFTTSYGTPNGGISEKMAVDRTGYLYKIGGK